jgi:hypothetical protein
VLRLLLPGCILSGCAGLITSDLKPQLRPRTAGAITLATGIAVSALAATAWIADDPGSSSGCGGHDGNHSNDGSEWLDTSDDCGSSRMFAIIMAIPAAMDLYMGTRSLATNTYPWHEDDDDDSTPDVLSRPDPATPPGAPTLKPGKTLAPGGTMKPRATLRFSAP